MKAKTAVGLPPPPNLTAAAKESALWRHSTARNEESRNKRSGWKVWLSGPISELQLDMVSASNKRNPISEDKLRKLAGPNGSLYYEALMMKEAAARCVKPQGGATLDESVSYNMAIESFLIHFRNVRDFLYPDDNVRADDVIAFDYDPGWTKTGKDWQECSKSERDRVNKLLAHISYSRDILDHNWLTGIMRQRIMQGMAELIQTLPPERRSWFEAWGLERAIAAAKR
jgi:hypothetical protein